MFGSPPVDICALEGEFGISIPILYITCSLPNDNTMTSRGASSESNEVQITKAATLLTYSWKKMKFQSAGVPYNNI